MCSISHLEHKAHPDIGNPTITVLHRITNMIGLKSAMLFVTFCSVFFFLFSFLTSRGLLEQSLEFHFYLPAAVFLSISLHIVWLVVALDIPLYVCL